MSKILVFGDSIAYGKWDIKGGWVSRLREYVDKKYNSSMQNNFQVYNLGIPGDVVGELEKRLSLELAVRIPKTEATNKKNLVVLAIGINDSCPNNWMMKKQTSPKEFKISVANCIDAAKIAGCEVVCIGLTPINKDKAKELQFTNDAVEEYDNYISEICSEKNVKKLSLLESLKDNNFTDLLVDAVHPNDRGHELIFQKILEFFMNEKVFDFLIS